MLHEAGRSKRKRSCPSPRFLRPPLLDSRPVFSTLPLFSFARQRAAKELRLPPGTRREALVRFALSVLVGCAALLTSAGAASAAPIGMCADTAQSIEAPPPMFPADDSELRVADEWSLFGCQPDDDARFRPKEPGAPSDRVAPSYETPDNKVILGEALTELRPGSVRIALTVSSLCLPEEHRWRGLRPPRS